MDSGYSGTPLAVAGFADGVAHSAMLWIAWPRRAAGHQSDITDNDRRELRGS